MKVYEGIYHGILGYLDFFFINMKTIDNREFNFKISLENFDMELIYKFFFSSKKFSKQRNSFLVKA